MRYLPLVLAAALLLALPTTAQRRIRVATALQPQAQFELPLTGDDYVFGAFNLQHLRNQFAGTPTFPVQSLRLGYEHFISSSWSWGATLHGTRVEDVYRFGVPDDAAYVLTPEVFGRHWNTFGSVNFRQRLGLLYPIDLDETGSSRLAASLRLDVDQVFPLGGGSLALRPRVAVEPIAYVRFQRDETEVKEPFLDFSQLRGEVGVRLSPRFDFTPWFAWQNSYFTSLPQFDMNGNVTIPSRTIRYAQPVVGLDMRMTLGSSAPERRQLPTHY